MATYKEIQAYMRDSYGYTPKTGWIAHVKELCGLPVRRAANRRSVERMEPCPAHRRADIQDALEHFGMLEFSADEAELIACAEGEVPILEVYRPHEIQDIWGVYPEIRMPLAQFYVAREEYRPRRMRWLFAPISEFLKSVERLDPKLLGRVLRAISELCMEPMQLHGDTVKPLGGELTGKWRYRVGDYRLIYLPDQETGIVYLLALLPRGAAYAK